MSMGFGRPVFLLGSQYQINHFAHGAISSLHSRHKVDDLLNFLAGIPRRSRKPYCLQQGHIEQFITDKRELLIGKSVFLLQRRMAETLSSTP